MSLHHVLRPKAESSCAAIRSQQTFTFLLLGLCLCATFVSAPVMASVEETLTGAPDSSALAPHVELPDFGTIDWPLDCSQWPQNPPDDGYLASVFGHRIHGSSADFHRGMDLRCDQQGDTCCQAPGEAMHCDATACVGNEVEVEGAPILALVGGVIKDVHDGDNNNLVVETELSSDDITIGDTDCDKLYIWYQHMRTDYAESPETELEWAEGDTVEKGDILGWQGKSGANTVHLHLSVRACESSRADGDPEGTLDPEVNPFQLIGTDNSVAPEILSLTTAFDGDDLLVTVQVETDDPDFDQLQITVYDQPRNLSHIRRLGYNSRFGIDVVGDDLDTYLLDPRDLSELTAIDEPNPPDATSGFTLAARFEDLELASDPDSLVQVKVADVFGNTSIEQVPLFGEAEIGDFAWDDEDGDGIQDSGEAGLAGVDVELYRSGGQLVGSTVTDSQGAYGFSELVAGDYYLRFVPPTGYGATVQVAGYPDLDSDIDPQTRETEVFTLSSTELELSLDAGFTAACFDVALVSYTSEWRTTDTYASGWEASSFDDSGWDQHLGVLGYDNSLVYSTIPETGLTSYFRLEFEIEDVSLYDTLDLSVLRDDGAVVYLNGSEVMRTNMPSGTIDANTPASSHSTATEAVNLPASHLLTGTNVLAVEVHNRALGVDLVFDLELRSSVCRSCLGEAVLVAGAGTFIDSSDPTDTEGDDDEIKIDGDPERSGLLSWDLTGLPSDVEVLHAELALEVVDDSSHRYRIFAMNRTWDEDTASWINATGGTTPVTWGTAGANGTSDRGDVALGLVHLADPAPTTGSVVLNPSGRALVQSWLDGSAGNHGLVVHGDTTQSYSLKLQSDDGASPPTLRLVYATGCGE